MGRQIKYMGTADIRTIPKGTTFGGQLKEEDATAVELVFDKSNYWVVDVEEVGLSEEAADLLAEDIHFKDVTDLKRVPTNGHQATFLGMKSVSEAETDLVSTAASTTSDAETNSGGSTAGAETATAATGVSAKKAPKGSTTS